MATDTLKPDLVETGAVEAEAAPPADPEPLGHEEEHLGIGLAPGDVLAGDDGVDPAPHAETVEHERDVFLGGRGADADPHAGGGQRLDQLPGAVHAREVLFQDLAEEPFLASVEPGDLRAGEVSPVLADHLAAAAAEARRELRFRQLAVIETVSFLIGFALVAVVLAWLGMGAMALAIAQLARVVVRGVPDKGVTLASIGKKGNLYMSKVPPVLGVAHPAFALQAPAFAAQLARIEVDPDTGEVTLHDFVVVQDAGNAINPLGVEGQMQGGAVQSLGIALTEGMMYDDSGRLMNPSLLDYRKLTAADLPNIETIIVEVPAPSGRWASGSAGYAATASSNPSQPGISPPTTNGTSTSRSPTRSARSADVTTDRAPQSSTMKRTSGAVRCQFTGV